jgi:8-oxo-dGTP pyrophosphatase MutT (NUDIX family)
VYGHYRKGDDTHLKKLFNNMTYHEKMDILSLKFNLMWYRVYKTSPDQVFLQGNNAHVSKQYMRKKTKFEASFLQDGGVRLKRLISSTNNAETLWEIPKGRRMEESNEEYVNAAIREFTEETAINSKQYKLLLRINPYVETYSDFGITYQNTYYYAEAIGDWEPTIKFSDGAQISEVSDICWCSLEDIKNMKLDTTTHKRLMKMFSKISKKYKNSI